MALADETEKFVRDPRFQGLSPEEKVETFRRYAIAKKPEFGSLGQLEQLDVIGQIIGKYEPGFWDKFKAGAGAVADYLPVVGPVKRAVEKPESIRPFMEFLLAGEQPEDIEKVMESPVARATGALSKDLAEMTAFFGAAGGLATKAVSKFLPNATATAAGALATASGEAAVETARLAAKQAIKQKIATRLGTDFLAGEMYGVAQAVEEGELRPLEHLVINPLFMTALGGVMLGAEAGFSRLGLRKVPEAVQTMAQDPAFAGTAQDATRIAKALSRTARVSMVDAGEIVVKAATGELNAAEAFTLKSLLAKQPELMDSDFGLLLVKKLRPHLETKFQFNDGPLVVRFEDTKTRTETTVQPNEQQAKELVKRMRDGEVHLIDVTGNIKEVKRIFPGDFPTGIPQPAKPIPSALEAGMAARGEALPAPRQRPDPAAPREPGLAGTQQPPVTIETAQVGGTDRLQTTQQLAMAREGVKPKSPLIASPLVDSNGKPIEYTPMEKIEQEMLRVEPFQLPTGTLQQTSPGSVLPPRQPPLLESRLAQVGPRGSFVVPKQSTKEALNVARKYSKVREYIEGEGATYAGVQEGIGDIPESALITIPDAYDTTIAIPIREANKATIRRRIKETIEKMKADPPKDLLTAPPPLPGTQIRVEGSFTPAEVVSTTDPRGWVVKSPGGKHFIATPRVGNTIVTDLIEFTPPKAGILSGAQRRGDSITLSFEAGSEIPPTSEIEKLFKNRGYSVEVTRFNPNIVSLTKGEVKFKITVKDASGRISEESAKKAYAEMVGQATDVVSSSVYSQNAPLEQRLQRTVEAMTKSIQDGSPTPMKTKSGKKVVVTSDPQTGATTLADRDTGTSTTMSSADVMERIRAGELVPREETAATRTTAELINLAHQMSSRRRAIKGDPVYAEQARQLDDRLSEYLQEFQRRTGRVGEPLSRTEGVIAEEFLKVLNNERGSISFRRQDSVPGGLRPLGDDNLVAAQAKMVGAKAYRDAEGNIVVKFGFGDKEVPVTYRSEIEADAALRRVLVEKVEGQRIAASVERQVKAGKLDDPIKPVSAEELDPMLRVDQLVNKGEVAPLNSPARYLQGSPWVTRNELLPVRTRLRRMFAPGQALDAGFERVDTLQGAMNGRDLAIVEAQVRRLEKAKISGEEFFRTIEQGEAGPNAGLIREVHEELSSVVDRQYASGKALGLSVKERVQNYIPHVFDIASLKDSKQAARLVDDLIADGFANSPEQALVVLDKMGVTGRERAVKSLIDSKAAQGIKMTVTEAEHILDRFLSRNAKTLSGHLERERLGIGGYSKDVRRAYTVTAMANNRRLAWANVFGVEGKKAYELVDQIRTQLGSREAQFAKETLDLMLGRSRRPLTGFLKELNSWQNAKLSMSVFSNMQGSLNVATRTSYTKWFGALAKQLLHPVEGTKHAAQVGAAAHGILNDIEQEGLEALFSVHPKTVWGQLALKGKRSIETVNSALFNLVEIAGNRSVAVRAGETYFDSLAADLRRGLTKAERVKVDRRLREYGLTAEAVMQATPEDLGVMRSLVGKRASDQTQFAANVLSRPLWAAHPLGQVVFRFKGFAYGQAEFIIREIFGNHGDGARRLRALALIGTVYPMTGYAALRAKEFATTGEQGKRSREIDNLLQDDEFVSYALAGALGLGAAGGLGIMSDLATTAYSGNSVAVNSLFSFPLAGTAANALTVGRSVIDGAVSADPKEFERAARAFSKELGGLGTALSTAALGPAQRSAEGEGGGF